MPATPMTVDELLQDDSFLRWRLQDAPEDRAVWERYLQQFPAEEPRVRRARQELALIVTGLEAVAREEDWERIRLQIEQPVGEPANPSVPRTRRLYRRWAVAAAILLLAAGLALLTRILPHHAKSLSNPPILVDILPGGNKATLTLGNGQRIFLDSAARGNLALQGNTRVTKTDSNRLAYTPAAPGTAAVVYNTLSTPRGGQFQLTLPDGTRAWLNAASSITYPTAFTGKDRPVQITGEVYFDVTHDARKPFRVSVGDMNLQVLGTQFNINAYPGEEDIKTTLLEGSVKIGAALLRPAMQARVKRGEAIRVTEDADIDRVVAWKNNLFIFSGDDIGTIMRQLGRWYNVEAEIRGDMTGRHFSGIISRNHNISQVLNMLESTGKVKFRVEGTKVTVTP